jgi:SpoVK/Ycf46/Vps4 family AAA+-type ATPase
MKQPKLQERYNLITEGKGNKKDFLREAQKQFPDKIRNGATFEEASQALKDKHIINENIVGVQIIGSPYNRTPEPFEKAFEAYLKKPEVDKEVINIQSKNFDLKDSKNPDNMLPDQYKNGVYYEAKANPDKTIDEVKDDEFWYSNNTMTSAQVEEFKKYAIPLLKKIFKFNKSKAESTFSWFNLAYGLRVKENEL